MGGLAHLIENQGIVTTQISLIREHTEKIKPPRALWVPFDLGRPLGAADETAFQKKVVVECLNLLKETSGPVLRNFSEEMAVPDESETVIGEPFHYSKKFLEQLEDENELIENFREEIFQLMPWYRNSVNRRGRTTVGNGTVKIEDMPEFICYFLKTGKFDITESGLAFIDSLNLIFQDLKAFYSESLLIQSGNFNAARVNDWFWKETVGGKVLYRVREKCSQSNSTTLKALGKSLIVPVIYR